MLKTVYNGETFKAPFDGNGIFVSWMEFSGLFERSKEYLYLYLNKQKKIAYFSYENSPKSVWTSFKKYGPGNLTVGIVRVESSDFDSLNTKTSLYSEQFAISKNEDYLLDIVFSDSEVVLRKGQIKMRVFLRPKENQFTLPNLSDAETDSSDFKICSGETSFACPPDPRTNKPMSICLNWRRVDDIGIECGLLLNSEQKNSSVDIFCNKYTDAEDCRCVNRTRYKEYTDRAKMLPYNSMNDFCWYPDCKSGDYLVDYTGQTYKCDNKFCISTYEVQSGGSTSFNNVTTKIECNEIASSPTVSPPTVSPPTVSPPTVSPTPVPVYPDVEIPKKPDYNKTMTFDAEISKWFAKNGLYVATALLFLIILYR